MSLCITEVDAVLRGINGLNIDAKGRMTMPMRYRENLVMHGNSMLVLTIHTEVRCLLLYPQHEWELLAVQLANLPSFNRAASRIQRLLIGHATDVEMDHQGRILLPPLLREYAELSKNLFLVGQGKKFELWDKERWNKSRECWLHETSAIDAELPEEIKQIAL